MTRPWLRQKGPRSKVQGPDKLPISNSKDTRKPNRRRLEARVWYFPGSRSLDIGDSHALLVDPLILPKPLERPPDALLNSERRFPTRRLNLLCVEEDERVVADPAAVASGVLEAGL